LIIAAALATAAPLPAGALARRPLSERDVGGGRVQRARVADLRVLPYQGGPVLHWNRTHLIFWAPEGSGLTFEATLIGRPTAKSLMDGYY